MISVTLSAESSVELGRRLVEFGNHLLADGTPKASPNESGPKAEPKKEEKPAPKSEQKVEKKKAESLRPTGNVTLETVAAKIAEICNNKSLGKEKAKELLASFGAKKGGELKPEDYATFVAKADALSKPAEDEDGLM